MLLTDEEGRARSRRVQPIVTPQQPGAKRRDLGLWLGVALPLVLGGCSDVPNQANPVTWWHDLEGGEIAKDRPPPPNPDAPFPRIAAQPARPAGMPDWEWAQLSATLAAQRAAAQTYAAQNPIPALPAAPAVRANAPPVAAPAPVPAAPPAAPAEAAQSAATAAEIARLAAAPGPAGSQTPAPSATAVATATANAGNTSTSDATGGALTFQGPTPPPASTRSAGPKRVPISGSAGSGDKISYFDPNNGLSIPGALSPVAQPDEAHPPPIPATVPEPPAVPGFAIPTIPSTYTPPKPLPEPAPYVPPAALPAVGPVPIQFAPHSAVLTPPMQKALLNLMQASHGARFAVTGFGDATSDSIGDQAAAMPLALERTRAMVVQLMADGATQRGITAGARALGQGGLARLVD